MTERWHARSDNANMLMLTRFNVSDVSTVISFALISLTPTNINLMVATEERSDQQSQ